MIEELTIEIRQLRADVEKLTLLLLKNCVDQVWLKEEIAAEMLGLKPRALRNYVTGKKSLFADIDYRHTNGRSFEYRRKDLMRFKELTSCNPQLKNLN